MWQTQHLSISPQQSCFAAITRKRKLWILARWFLTFLLYPLSFKYLLSTQLIYFVSSYWVKCSNYIWQKHWDWEITPSITTTSSAFFQVVQNHSSTEMNICSLKLWSNFLCLVQQSQVPSSLLTSRQILLFFPDHRSSKQSNGFPGWFSY